MSKKLPRNTMTTTTKEKSVAQVTTNTPAISSAKPIKSFRFQNKSTVIGYNQGLYLGLSEDGKHWEWDANCIFDLSESSAVLNAEDNLQINNAYRFGEQVIVVLERSGGVDIQRDMVVLDSLDPWNVIAYLEDCDQSELAKSVSQELSPTLERYVSNPIITPRSENTWEAFTTFNPAAFMLNGLVHLLYRAQGYDYTSSLGYAASQDGYNITERLEYPVFVDRRTPVGEQGRSYGSGGSSGGVEDPRATVLESKVHVTYVSYDGATLPRLAYTSIDIDDFMRRDWQWKRPQFMSEPGHVDKSGVIFPGKVRGKYVVMHRVFPDIQIDYRDDLDFSENNFLDVDAVIPASKFGWDSRKIGAGPPPIETDEGWLLIYYGVDDRQAEQYHIGAMLLDRDYPEQVIARSQEPILSPQVHYEMNGFKPGILYPCGAVKKEESLLVYYGTADKYVSVATANINELIMKLKRSGSPKLQIKQRLLASTKRG